MTMTPGDNYVTAEDRLRRLRPELTMAAGYARALFDLAVAKGADPKLLAERSGLQPAELDDQDGRIPFATYVTLMRAGQALSGEPALGLHFGEAYDIAELSIVGLIGQACETVGEAFAQLNRYSRLVVEVGVSAGDRLVLSRERGRIWLVDTRSDPNALPELTESAFARMVCASRRAGHAGLVQAVHVTHPPPSYRAEYERVFQTPVVFGSDRNALLLRDDAWLNERLPTQRRYVFGVFAQRADSLLNNLEKAATIRGRVEALLLPVLHAGAPAMDDIAGRLGMSRRTLTRRLAAEGSTFQRVLDDLRRVLAIDYLSARKVSVNETAYLVGFSDPAAFSRAFRRWTGRPPSQMRRSP